MELTAPPSVATSRDSLAMDGTSALDISAGNSTSNLSSLALKRISPDQRSDARANPYIKTIPADHSTEAEHLLALTDLGLLSASLALSWGLSLYVQPELALTLGQSLAPFAHFGLLLPLLAINAICGVYSGFGLTSANRLRLRLTTNLAWMGYALMFSLAMGYASLPLLLTALLALPIAPLLAGLGRIHLQKHKKWGKPVLVLGPEKQIAQIFQTLQQNWHLGFIPVQQQDVEASQMAKVDTIVLAPGAVVSPSLGQNRRLYVMKDVGLPTLISPRPHSHLEQFVERQRLHNPRGLFWRALKRTMDLAIGGTALVLAAPLMAVVAAIIYAVDPGPVFYAQERSGLNGQRFKVYKLRSMYQDSAERLQHLLATDPIAAEEWHSRYKLANDPRVLPKIGRFIRKFSVDELPQLWGVLTGQLSLVGPRVFADYDMAIYSPDALALRQSVVPGLTGLWQVSVRNDGDNDDKIRYDLAYVRNWSIWMDIDVLYRTVGVVLAGRGA